MKLLHKQKKSQQLVSLPPTASVMDAAKLMAEKGVGSVVVMEGEALRGIFTERDVLTRVMAKSLDASKVKLSDVMSSHVTTADINESLESCYEKMQAQKSRHVPLVDGGKVVGMVTMRNILEWLWKEINDENQQLKDYISQSG